MNTLTHPLFVLLAASMIMLGGCQHTYKISDLDGTWVGQDETINARGISLTKKTVVLDVDDKGLIRGTTSWDLVNGAGGDRLETPTNRDSEAIIGVFEPSTGRFYLAEMEEPGFWHGEMLSKNKVRCFLVQTGPKPVVSTVVLERQSD